jgi:AraC-like DNA-binding protein
MLDNLTGDLCVEALAEKVAMSPRNFTRVFTRETGVSPARYVAEARLPPPESGSSKRATRWNASPSNPVW